MSSALWLSIFLVTLYQAEGLIILVHGSFAKKSSWHQPGGDFFEALKFAANKKQHQVISFSWSGWPFKKDIDTGARALAYFIATYPQQHKEIILIGHSHGGNVILKASQHLQNITRSYPFRCDIIRAARIKTLAQTRMTKHYKTPIHRAYLLGTPIDTKNFMPNTNTIKNICTFYSSKDWIQPVVGLYKRKLPQLPESSNIKTWINHRGAEHSNLHHPAIASWLLSIPEELAQDNTSGFHLFKWGNDGGINFYSTKKPEFILMRELDIDLANVHKTAYPDSIITQLSSTF